MSKFYIKNDSQKGRVFVDFVDAVDAFIDEIARVASPRLVVVNNGVEYEYDLRTIIRSVETVKQLKEGE